MISTSFLWGHRFGFCTLYTLAQEYYGDSSLWWIISIANNNTIQNSLTPPVGSQIRIPSNPTPIIAEYEIINN